MVVCTWAPNTKAAVAGWELLQQNASVVDVVEAAIKVPEADPSDVSVGYGGLPDRDGKVTLDACMMTGKGDCGAVLFLEGIKHSISVAKAVMQKTPHVQLVGEGALQFALAEGFSQENLLTPQAEEMWRQWLKDAQYDPMTIPKLLQQKEKGAMPNHDTIGLLAIDKNGNLAGGCSTSGMAFKMRGRVGDSPIIGAGLFVDQDAGAATATGVGEEVVRICGSHTVVEYLRQGLSPEAACKKTVERIIKKRGVAAKELQVGFIAVDKWGRAGGYALQKGFTYVVRNTAGMQVIHAKYFYA